MPVCNDQLQSTQAGCGQADALEAEEGWVRFDWRFGDSCERHIGTAWPAHINPLLSEQAGCRWADAWRSCFRVCWFQRSWARNLRSARAACVDHLGSAQAGSGRLMPGKGGVSALSGFSKDWEGHLDQSQRPGKLGGMGGRQRSRQKPSHLGVQVRSYSHMDIWCMEI